MNYNYWGKLPNFIPAAAIAPKTLSAGAHLFSGTRVLLDVVVLLVGVVAWPMEAGAGGRCLIWD